jgi:hypothetical protein
MIDNEIRALVGGMSIKEIGQRPDASSEPGSRDPGDIDVGADVSAAA